MQFFDTHCHLQDERFKNAADTVIRQALDDGVEFFVCCGSSESDWGDVAALARNWKQVIPAFGIHPWYQKSRSTEWLEHLRSFLDEFPAAAVAEIGLDHLHSSDDWNEQKNLFIQQLELAVELNRPVSIHCLKAWGDLVSAFSSVQDLPVSVVLHSFSGSPEMVRVLEKMGCYFSFSGAVTYGKHAKIRKAAQLVDAERLLLETDSPDIPPVGYYGYTRPSAILQINRTVASLRGLNELEMADIVYKNALKCFKVHNG
jgi:TatD DNase family protein